MRSIKSSYKFGGEINFCLSSFRRKVSAYNAQSLDMRMNKLINVLWCKIIELIILSNYLNEQRYQHQSHHLL